MKKSMFVIAMTGMILVWLAAVVGTVGIIVHFIAKYW